MLESLQEVVIPDHLSCEFIVIDNNSADDTQAVLKAMGNHGDSRVRSVFEGKKGLSHARNRGITEARGEIIAFTDDDVIVDKHWIQSIDSAFSEHEDVACVGGRILPIFAIPKPQWLNSNLCNLLGLLDHGNSVAYLDTPHIWGANFAVKSEMFKKYGLFDARLGRRPGKLYGGEETEFLWRLIRGEENLLYHPSSIIYHHVPAHRMSKNYLRKWRYDQGELEATLAGETKYLAIMWMPLFTIGQMIRQFAVSLLKICSFKKERFEHELAICHILGFLFGRLKRMLVTP
jgi:glycosyltransferase involved in cell wall biosynthesis